MRKARLSLEQQRPGAAKAAVKTSSPLFYIHWELAEGVRVVEVIPGKSVMGLEIPNEKRELVTFGEMRQLPAPVPSGHVPQALPAPPFVRGKRFSSSMPTCVTRSYTNSSHTPE